MEKLREAAEGAGANASKLISIPRRDHARCFLGTDAPFIAFVAPSRLYGGAPVPWAHAIVVLAQRDKRVLYHDPDGVVGGCRDSTSQRVFLNAWRQWGFTALVVRT